jgi:hypothetical protein
MAPGRLRVIRSPPKEASPVRLKKTGSSGGLKKNPLVSNQILRSLFTEVRFVWDEKAIPDEQRTLFMECIEGLPLRKKAVTVAKHIEELISNKAMVQYVLRTIQAREKALKKLQGLCEHASQAGLEDAVVQQSIDLLSAFRLLSLNVVECIAAWRDQLAGLNPSEIRVRKAAFLYEGQSYFLKMKQDIDFLKESPLNQLFEFAAGPDPFLKAAASNKRSRTKLELSIPYAMKSRINKAEFLIIEEASAQQISTTYVPKSALPSQRRIIVEPSVLPDDPEPVEKVRSLSHDRIAKDNVMRQSRKRLDELKESLELRPEDNLVVETEAIEVIGLEDNVESALESYIQGVTVEIRETFGDAKSTYSVVVKSPYPCFLWLKQGKTTVGLLAFNIDTQSMLSKRIVVNHFSCLHPHRLAELLKIALDYLWKTYPADEVRVALAYRDIDGKFAVDEFIKARLDEAGFKWRNLTNTGDGKRLLIMGLKRPEAQLCTNSQLAVMFQETIVLNLASVVTCKAEEEEDQPQELEGSACVVTILAALQQLPVKPSETPGHFEALLTKTGTAFKFPAIKALASADPAEVLKLLAAQNFTISLPSELAKTAAAVSSLGFTWFKFLPVKATVAGRSIAYNYIRESEISVAKSAERQVYIVPIDRSFSVFIIPGAVEGDLLTATQRITQGISEIVDVKDSILIPSFKLSRHSSVKGVQVPLTDLSVAEVIEEFSLELRTTLHPKGSLSAAPESVLRVEGSFVFGEVYLGFMHSQIEEKLACPYFAVAVSPGDWQVL